MRVLLKAAPQSLQDQSRNSIERARRGGQRLQALPWKFTGIAGDTSWRLMEFMERLNQTPPPLPHPPTHTCIPPSFDHATSDFERERQSLRHAHPVMDKLKGKKGRLKIELGELSSCGDLFKGRGFVKGEEKRRVGDKTDEKSFLRPGLGPGRKQRSRDLLHLFSWLHRL